MRASSCCRRPRRPARAGRQRSLATESACVSERGWANDNVFGGFSGVGYHAGASGATRHPSQGSSQEEEFMGKKSMDSARTRGRCHLAGQRMRVQQHVAERIRAGRIRAGRIRAGRIGTGRIRIGTGRIRIGTGRRSISRRSRPATPSLTRRSAPTSRSTARRSRSRRSGPAARAKASPPRSPTSQTATGIAVQVDSIGSSHETVLKTRIEGGSPPDMAALAQPTGVLAYASAGQGQRRRHVHGPAREAQG